MREERSLREAESERGAEAGGFWRCLALAGFGFARAKREMGEARLGAELDASDPKGWEGLESAKRRAAEEALRNLASEHMELEESEALERGEKALLRAGWTRELIELARGSEALGAGLGKRLGKRLEGKGIEESLREVARAGMSMDRWMEEAARGMREGRDGNEALREMMGGEAESEGAKELFALAEAARLERAAGESGARGPRRGM